MKAALRGSYIEFVCYMGITEKYPLWFEKEIDNTIYMDENRFTFYVFPEERTPDYYEKELIEDYSVFLRKSDGEVHVTDYETMQYLYTVFKYSEFTNSGIAALDADCIEYVECQPGVLSAAYPTWFYEFFTEAIHFPQKEETIFFYAHDTLKTSDNFKDDVKISVGENDVEICVDVHCVFLRNKFGEIRGMLYDDFIKYYDPDPFLGR